MHAALLSARKRDAGSRRLLTLPFMERDGAFQPYVNDMFPDGIVPNSWLGNSSRRNWSRRACLYWNHKKPLPEFPKMHRCCYQQDGAVLRHPQCTRRWPLLLCRLCPDKCRDFEASLAAGGRCHQKSWIQRKRGGTRSSLHAEAAAGRRSSGALNAGDDRPGYYGAAKNHLIKRNRPPRSTIPFWICGDRELPHTVCSSRGWPYRTGQELEERIFAGFAAKIFVKTSKKRFGFDCVIMV